MADSAAQHKWNAPIHAEDGVSNTPLSIIWKDPASALSAWIVLPHTVSFKVPGSWWHSSLIWVNWINALRSCTLLSLGCDKNGSHPTLVPGLTRAAHCGFSFGPNFTVYQCFFRLKLHFRVMTTRVNPVFYSWNVTSHQRDDTLRSVSGTVKHLNPQSHRLHGSIREKKHKNTAGVSYEGGNTSNLLKHLTIRHGILYSRSDYPCYCC